MPEALLPYTIPVMEQSPSLEWATPPWFLTTAPKPAGAIMARTRLHGLLEACIHRNAVTLVSAPSGFGKSSALSTWAAHRTSPLGWLSLTWMSSIDERRFLGGILGALQRLQGQLRPADQELLGHLAPGSLSADDFLHQLCLTGAQLSEPVVIVIDDAHLVDAQSLRRMAGILSMHSGFNLRLVLSGTDNFAKHFAAELRNGNAVLIGPEELSFTGEEVQEHYGLAPEQAAEVISECSGWPIAVHLSMLAPEQSANTLDLISAYPAVENSSDELVQYVQEAVLRQLPETLQQFVLATTSCLRIDAVLAQRLSGMPESTALLEECVARGLFLERYLDPNAETMYRWYEPFAKLCQILLKRLDPARSRELNKSAACALRHEDPLDAIHHALDARDSRTCRDIIRTYFLRILCESGARLLNAACLQLEQLEPLSADLLMIRACALDAMGDGTGAAVLQRTAASMQAMTPKQGPQEQAMAFCGLFLARSSEELGQAVDCAREFLPNSDISPQARAYQLFCVGWSELRLRRNTADAVRFLRSSMNDAEALNLPALKRLSQSNLAFALSFGGDFVSARQLTPELATGDGGSDLGVHNVGWKFYDGGITAFTLVYLDFWQGRTDECSAHLAELFRLGGHGSSYLALGCVFNALLVAATGNSARIQQAAEQMERVSSNDQHGVPWGSYKALGQAALKFAANDVDAALALLAPYKYEPNIPVMRVCAADIYRRAGKLEEASVWLSQLKPQEMASYIAAYALVVSAAVARERGERPAAHEQLERALDIAAPAGIALPFTPTDDVLRRLLTEHAAWGTKHEGFLAPRIGQQMGISRTALICAQLSSREKEIFGYLCTTMTAEEIAAALFVSVNTVRTHQRSIYRKLGVNSRRDAIKLSV